MEAIIICAAPGVGKSTVLDVLLQKLLAVHADRCVALLDGDAVGRIFPRRHDQWLRMIRANVCACAERFMDSGAGLFIVAYCFSSQDDVDGMRTQLSSLGCCVHVLAWTVDDSDLIERNKMRGSSLPEDSEFLDLACRLNGNIRKLSGASVFDGTGLGVDATADGLSSVIIDECRCCKGGGDVRP